MSKQPPDELFEAPGPWERKVWGWTRLAVQSPVYQRHELYAERGYCSIHYHKERANLFRVLDGSIRVRVWHGWYPGAIDADPAVVELAGGDELQVPSTIPHQFEVLAPGRVIEEYWPDGGGTVRVDDIVRITEGGC